MKIDERTVLLDPRLRGVLEARRGLAEFAPPARDRVSVSDAARDLVQLRAALGEIDAPRQEKVTALRAMMAKGSYGADPEQVARKLLREVLGELLG
jgi:flagellar biosynthesis anti-sigma factor FlgM